LRNPWVRLRLRLLGLNVKDIINSKIYQIYFSNDIKNKKNCL